MSAAIDRVMGVLADGDWHRLDGLIDAVAPLMAPGPAYRRSELGRRRRQELRDQPVTDRQRGDNDSAIAAGRRTAARNVVRGLRRRGRVEERGGRSSIEVRAIPLEREG